MYYSLLVPVAKKAEASVKSGYLGLAGRKKVKLPPVSGGGRSPQVRLLATRRDSR